MTTEEKQDQTEQIYEQRMFRSTKGRIIHGLYPVDDPMESPTFFAMYMGEVTDGTEKAQVQWEFVIPGDTIERAFEAFDAAFAISQAAENEKFAAWVKQQKLQAGRKILTPADIAGMPRGMPQPGQNGRPNLRMGPPHG